MPRAGEEMVVDHAGRLHEGVDDRRPAELEAARLEVLRDGARQLRLGGDRGDRLVAVDDRLPAGEVPEIGREARAALNDVEPGAGRGIAPSIFMRLRTIPSSRISPSTLRGV
jgi:hypothetical protein